MGSATRMRAELLRLAVALAFLCALAPLVVGCALDRVTLAAGAAPSDAGLDASPPPSDAGSAIRRDASQAPLDAWQEQSAPDAGACALEPCGAPPGTCAYDWIPTLVPGERVEVNLCGRSDDHQQRDAACGRAAHGEDSLVRVQIEAAGHYRLTLRDVDGPAAIDTVLYLRSDCEAGESEFACDDDVRCDDADEDLRTNCEEGRQPRQSRLDVRLERGSYFAVVDSVEREGFRCGLVQLRLQARGDSED